MAMGNSHPNMVDPDGGLAGWEGLAGAASGGFSVMKFAQVVASLASIQISGDALSFSRGVSNIRAAGTFTTPDKCFTFNTDNNNGGGGGFRAWFKTRTVTVVDPANQTNIAPGNIWNVGTSVNIRIRKQGTFNFNAFLNPDQLNVTRNGNPFLNTGFISGTRNGTLGPGKYNFTVNPGLNGPTVYNLNVSENFQHWKQRTTKLLFGFIPFSVKTENFQRNVSRSGLLQPGRFIIRARRSHRRPL